MKMSKSLQTFAIDAGLEDLFVKFADYWKHYQSKEQGKKLEFDTTVSFDEKEAKMNAALKKAIIKRSGINYANESNLEQWFYHPLVVHETFAIVGALIDMILPESLIESIGLYSDVRVGGWGDSFAFDIEPRDLFAVSKAGRAQRSAEVHKQFKGQVTVLPEMRELTVGVSLYRVLAGAESLAALAAKAVRSIETKMSYDVYDLFATTMAAVSQTTTTGLYVTGYTQAYLVRLCQQVTAWNQGAKAVVVGTQLALVNVLPDDANYRYTLNDEYMTLGYVRTAFGYDVMALPQVADISTPFGTKISNSYIWVLSPSSQKIVKLCLEGNTLSNTTGPFDRANLSQETTMWKSWGTGVATNAVGGVIAI
jgi:hypothetical protein